MGLENDCFLWDLKVNALASLAKMVDCSLTNYVVMYLIPVAVTQSFKFQMLYLFQAKVEGQAIAEWIFFWIVTVIVIELCYLNCLILSLHFLGHALFSSFIIKTDFWCHYLSCCESPEKHSKKDMLTILLKFICS